MNVLTNRFLTGALALGLSSGLAAACGSVETAPFVTGGASSGHGGGATTATTASSGSTGGGATTSTTGTGGSGGCSSAADCSDGFSCTIDACNAGTCSHTVGPNSGATACPVGSFCLLDKGCIPGTVCATTAQCVTALGGDACKANLACDAATSICTYTMLDKDGDGHPPVVCGGDDCDDGDAARYPGAPEVCDGKDNDCNGPVDDGATCPSPATCTGGACVCPAANACGAACVDKMTDPNHCGTCTTVCPSGATCTAGTCQCSAMATVCNGACVDIKTDPNNCNGCGNTCATGYSCQSGACSCLKTSCGGACVDTMSDPAHCGTCANQCPAGTVCQAGACACPGTSKQCGTVCADTTSDPSNCGNCGVKCPAGNTCQASVCVGCPAVDLFILQDLSSSMSTVLGTVTRLQNAVTGINAFTADTASTVGLGIGYFPVANAPCNASSYSTPAVAIAALPGNAAAISTSLAAAVVGAANTSPQAPALQGALTYVKSYVTSHPGHKGAVVLITDGLPDSCTTTGVATDVASVAAMFAAGTPSVKTYVVALGGDVQASLWNTIAVAGGTPAAVQVTNPAQFHDVQNALNGVRTVFGHCDMGAACAHDECVTGTVMEANCSSCDTAICLQDPYCCISSWDSLCKGEVPTLCAPKTCP